MAKLKAATIEAYLAIPRKPVSSSNLKAVGWKDKVLTVEFHSGQVWAYLDVSEELYDDLRFAGSIGKFFNEKIKTMNTIADFEIYSL